MQESGSVIEVAGGRAAIQIRRQRNEQCSGCAACRTEGGRGLVLRVEADDLKVGDRVTVEVPLVSPWRALLLVFGLPLAALMTGIAVGSQWTWLQAHLGLKAEATGLALGVALGLVAFGGAWLEDRRFAQRHRPHLLEVHRPA